MKIKKDTKKGQLMLTLLNTSTTYRRRLLLVAILAPLRSFILGLVALDAKLVMSNSLVDFNFLDATLVALGTAQLGMCLMRESHFTKRAAFILIHVGSGGKCGTGKGNQGDHGNHNFFHVYILLNGV